ncbi:MAG: CPBP family intramembrane glutamic endopeptidase [Myxococcota bacterium]
MPAEPALAPDPPASPRRNPVIRFLAWLLGEPMPRTEPEPGSVALLSWACAWAVAAMFVGDAYNVRGDTPLPTGIWRMGVHGALPFVAVGLWEARRVARARLPVLLGAACILAPLCARILVPGMEKTLAAEPLTWMLAPFAAGALLVRAGIAMTPADPAAWGMGMGNWRWWAPRVAFMAACIVPLCLIGGLLSQKLVDFYPRWKPAQSDPTLLALYFTALFMDLFGWEFLWRGFLLNAFARRGDALAAIFASAIPFFLLHYPKPDLEMLSSFPGGVLAGWFCLRARSSFPMWILHCVLFATMGTIGYLAKQ